MEILSARKIRITVWVAALIVLQPVANSAAANSAQARALAINAKQAVSAATASNTNLAAAPGRTFNVKRYGATGNGSTDDSQSVYDAIQAANQSPGSTVVFPTGTYFIGSAQPDLNPIGITLTGTRHAVLNFGSSAHISIAGAATGVQNLTIANTGTTAIGGINVGSATGFMIKGCTFTGWAPAVYMSGGQSGSISQNTFFIPAGKVGVFSTILYSNTSLACRIDRNLFSAVVSGSGKGIDLGSPLSVEVSGNAFNDLQYGAYVQGTPFVKVGAITLSGNTFANCRWGCWADNVEQFGFDTNICSNCPVSLIETNMGQAHNRANRFYSPNRCITCYNSDEVSISGNNAGNVGEAGIWLVGNKNVSVSRNVIAGKSDGSTLVGLLALENTGMTNVSGNTLTEALNGLFSRQNANVTVAGNSIRSTGQDGIYLYQDSGAETVTSNSLQNCGLSGGTAAIYVRGPAVIPTITLNKYTARTASFLSYFIYVSTGSATLSGNKTNTMLPSYP